MAAVVTENDVTENVVENGEDDDVEVIDEGDTKDPAKKKKKKKKKKKAGKDYYNGNFYNLKNE